MQTPHSHTSPDIHDNLLSRSTISHSPVASRFAVTVPAFQVDKSWHPTLTPYRLLVVLFITYVGATIYITRSRNFEDHSHDSPPIFVIGWIFAVVWFIGLYALRHVEKRKGSESWLRRILHEVDCVQTLKDWLRQRMRRGSIDKGKAPSRRPGYDPEEQSGLLDEFSHDIGPKLKDESDPPVEQFVLEEARSDTRFQVTIFRLLATILFLCFVLYKAYAVYPEVEWKEEGGGASLQSSKLTFKHAVELECVVETLGIVVLYWLSLYESSPPYIYPKIFHVDYRKDIQQGLTDSKTYLFSLCMLGSMIGVVFFLGCVYVALRIPGMEWVDTPEPSKGLYAAATKPLTMLFALFMGGGGLYGAHSLAEEGLKMVRPHEHLTVYGVLSETANSLMGRQRRARVGLWVGEKWSAVNEWIETEVFSERTPIRRAITRQIRKLGWTIVVCGLYVIGNLMFAWLVSMGVALIKTLDGTEHWIADVLIWGCGLIEMAIGLCMISVFGFWFKDYINGLIKEVRKDMEEGATTPTT